MGVPSMNKLSLFEPIATSILQTYADGILLLTEEGKTVYANKTAALILEQSTYIQEDIWAICQSLLQTADSETIDEFEFKSLRIRLRWITCELLKIPCLLVILIDQNQTVQNLAIAEAKQLKLTPSETKVYALHRAHYSSSEIAKALFISINTVKKHLRNIRQKRQVQDLN
jgi:DNA-binding CsgD family transcriptional regulator